MSRRSLGHVGLLEACADQDLFGASITLYPKQAEVLAAIESGPRMHVLALGRRSGKTTMAALVGLHDALFRPELASYVRPGEYRYVVGVATNLRQARLFLSQARAIVDASPLLRDAVEGQTEDEITFVTGAKLAAFPCTSRGGRGWAISTLLLDELAFFIDDTDGPQVGARVLNALLPATSQFGDEGRVILASTPWGVDGVFAETYQRAASGELEDAVAYHATSAEMNPTLSASFLESEEQRDPESFKSEYLAQFLGSGGAFFDADNVAAAVRLPGELRSEDAVEWVAGLDPGFSQDPFALTLVGRDPVDRRRLLVGLARSWTPSRRKAASLDESREIEDTVLAEVAQVIRLFGARAVTDQYKSAGVVERLRRYGISVRSEPMTAPSKDAAFGFLRGRINDGSIELYEHAELVRELRAIRTRYSAGRSSVVTPRIGRSHCDHAQALALAVLEHDRFGLGGGELLPLREPAHDEAAVTAGLIDVGPGFDRRAAQTSIAERSF